MRQSVASKSPGSGACSKYANAVRRLRALIEITRCEKDVLDFRLHSKTILSNKFGYFLGHPRRK